MTKKTIVTKAHFAKLCEVTRSAVTQAVAKGDIVSPDGFHVDLLHQTNEAYMIRNKAKAPFKQAKKQRWAQINGEIPGDAFFTKKMDRLTDKLPSDINGRILNEVQFLVIDLFSTFNGWSEGKYSELLIEKCPHWLKSSSESISEILAKKKASTD